MNRGFAIRSLSPLGHAAETPAGPPDAGGKNDTYIVRFDSRQVQMTHPRPSPVFYAKADTDNKLQKRRPPPPAIRPVRYIIGDGNAGRPRWEPKRILKVRGSVEPTPPGQATP